MDLDAIALLDAMETTSGHLDMSEYRRSLGGAAKSSIATKRLVATAFPGRNKQVKGRKMYTNALKLTITT